MPLFDNGATVDLVQRTVYMNSTASSFVIRSEAELPRHLTQWRPFVLGNTEIIFRHSADEVLATDGRVTMAGAIEFQTQITPGVLTDVCDPNEIYTANRAYGLVLYTDDVKGEAHRTGVERENGRL